MRCFRAGFLFFLVYPAFLFGQSVSLTNKWPELNQADQMVLEKEGKISRYHESLIQPALYLKGPEGELMAEKIRQARLNIGSEIVFQYTPLPASLASLTQKQRLLTISNVLRALSSLEGIPYYSHTRQKWRPLFMESWRIADPGSSETILDDPLIYDYKKGAERYYVHQKDSTFGKHRSEIIYQHYDQGVSLSFVNKTPLYYLRYLKVLDKDEMQMHILVMVSDEEMLIYGFCGGQAPDFNFVRSHAADSFYNRILALHDWFMAGLAEP